MHVQGRLSNVRGWWTRGVCGCAALAAFGAALAATPLPPVRVGIDAEFGVPGSTSAQAVRLGVELAVDEINARGGVLHGRELVVEVRDNRSVPARSIQNLREFAAMPDLVAVFCGKYSPLVVEDLPVLHTLQLPFLDPWAAADSITEHSYRPSYTFRLSLRDSWAVRTMLDTAHLRGFHRIGLLLPNTEWGRSNLRAVEDQLRGREDLQLAGMAWYNWGDQSMSEPYRALLADRAEVVILAANEREGALLIREMGAMPRAARRPILAHWGITGGRFFESSGAALAGVDLMVVQTFSFLHPRTALQREVLRAALQRSGVPGPRALPSPVGIAHAYDLTQILARAIELAGSTDRAAIRDALERVRDYHGLVRDYGEAFTATRHDALNARDVFMARYAADGAIEPVAGPAAGTGAGR